MTFDVDVLITFAQKDNETTFPKLTPAGNALQEIPGAHAVQVLGTKPNILLKDEFDSVNSVDHEKRGRDGCRALKDFVQSGRCLDTVESFNKLASSSKANRVFKVMKAPLLLGRTPPKLRELLGYDMFQIDTETGLMKEYSDFSQPGSRKAILDENGRPGLRHPRISSLPQRGNEVGSGRTLFRRKTIYLAKNRSRHIVQRNIIKRELQRHGYMVLRVRPFRATAPNSNAW